MLSSLLTGRASGVTRNHETSHDKNINTESEESCVTLSISNPYHIDSVEATRKMGIYYRGVQILNYAIKIFIQIQIPRK